MLLAIGFTRLVPWLMKIAIDLLREGEPPSGVAPYAVGMLGAAIVGGFFLYLQRWLLIGTSRRIARVM